VILCEFSDHYPLDRPGRVSHDELAKAMRPAGAFIMGLLDRLFGKPSIADFAEQMIEAFRGAGDNTDLRFDAAENCIVRSDADAPWTVNLANMYQAYLQTPRSERAEYVRSTARSLITKNPRPPTRPAPSQPPSFVAGLIIKLAFLVR
jgi:hypothetical protein